MFSKSLILRNISTNNDATSIINKYYKNPRSITPKLMQCIEEYDDGDFSLGEIIQMFVDGDNGLFNNQLNSLQTLVSVIVFYLSESKMPENSTELESFLIEHDIDKNVNIEDFGIILTKFETPEIKCSNMNGNPIFDRIDFKQIKNKIKEYNLDFDNDGDDYSPVVEQFIDNSDL